MDNLNCGATTNPHVVDGIDSDAGMCGSRPDDLASGMYDEVTWLENASSPRPPTTLRLLTASVYETSGKKASAAGDALGIRIAVSWFGN